MIDKSKQYRTRDGREVRIYATDGADHKIHGAILEHRGWIVSSWEGSGRFLTHLFDHQFDLIEVKPHIKREVWVNVYPDGRFGQIFKTKEEADECHYCKKVDPRIACVKLTIDCEEGEGL